MKPYKARVIETGEIVEVIGALYNKHTEVSDYLTVGEMSNLGTYKDFEKGEIWEQCVTYRTPVKDDKYYFYTTVELEILSYREKHSRRKLKFN